jgi:hypothetical protein
VSTHDPEIRRELEAAIAEAVARFGMAGDVFVEDTVARLVGSGPDVDTDIGMLADQWATLAPELRQRRATEIARRLVSARRVRLDEGHGAASRRPPQLIAPLVILALVGVAIYFAWRMFAPGGSGWPWAAKPVSSAPTADQYEAERVARAARVCQATRSRIMRGATVGPTDVEGWVVELVLSRDGADPTTDPALGEFFARGEDGGAYRLSWSGTPDIASQQGIGTDVNIAPEPLDGEKGIKLAFHGRYVHPYFDAARRLEYVKLANALAEKLGARHGALYGHCAGDDSHHLGAWFLGASPADAAATLVYFVGAFADPPQVRKSVLFPDGGTDVRSSGVFTRISESAKDIDRKKLATLIGTHSGALTGEGDGRTVMTFPFADSNRAARASLDAAKTIGVGIER